MPGKKIKIYIFNILLWFPNPNKFLKTKQGRRRLHNFSFLYLRKCLKAGQTDVPDSVLVQIVFDCCKQSLPSIYPPEFFIELVQSHFMQLILFSQFTSIIKRCSLKLPNRFFHFFFVFIFNFLFTFYLSLCVFVLFFTF